jgi:hypothetical protein
MDLQDNFTAHRASSMKCARGDFWATVSFSTSQRVNHPLNFCVALTRHGSALISPSTSSFLTKLVSWLGPDGRRCSCAGKGDTNNSPWSFCAERGQLP